jgi:hypothetical protein
MAVDDTRKFRSRGRFRIAWLIYATAITAIGVPLLYSAGASNWDGTPVILLNVVTWGLQSIVWFTSAMLAFLLITITAGVGGGQAQQLVAACIVFFALASLQFLVLWALVKTVRRLFRVMSQRGR